MTEPVHPDGVASAPTRRSRGRRLVASAVLVAAIAGLAIVGRTATDGLRWPGPWSLLIALGLCVASTASAARVWVSLIGGVETSALTGSVYASQLSKYVPAGGVLQAAGQMALTSTRGVAGARVAAAWLASALAMVAAGALATAMLVVVPPFQWWRLVGIAGLAAPFLLRHHVLARALRWSPARVRARVAPADLPTDRQLRVALIYAVANLGLYGVAYAVILRSIEATGDLGVVTVAYAVAWVAGFLAVPLPAGVGVREAVLVALTTGSSTGALLAASAVQRIVGAAAELLLLVANAGLRRWRRRVHTHGE